MKQHIPAQSSSPKGHAAGRKGKAPTKQAKRPARPTKEDLWKSSYFMINLPFAPF